MVLTTKTQKLQQKKWHAIDSESKSRFKIQSRF